MHLRFQVLSTQVFERHPDALIPRIPNDQGTPLDPKTKEITEPLNTGSVIYFIYINYFYGVCAKKSSY